LVQDYEGQASADRIMHITLTACGVCGIFPVFFRFSEILIPSFQVLAFLAGFIMQNMIAGVYVFLAGILVAALVRFCLI
jgi:hypothetical protein